MKWLGLYYLQKLFNSLRAYRRITFLLVASLISIGAALVIANTAWKIDKYTEQTSFYNCMLKNNAYEEDAGGTDICGGKAKRLRVSWSIFTVEIFLVSFGIGPYLAFGTESARQAIKRVCGWLYVVLTSPCSPGAYERYQVWIQGGGGGGSSGRQGSSRIGSHQSDQEATENPLGGSERSLSMSDTSSQPRHSHAGYGMRGNQRSLNSTSSVMNVTKSMIVNPNANRDRSMSYRSSETDESIVITPFYEGADMEGTSSGATGRKSFGVQKRSYLHERPSNE
jgi:hypothetical protein